MLHWNLTPQVVVLGWKSLWHQPVWWDVCILFLCSCFHLVVNMVILIGNSWWKNTTKFWNPTKVWGVFCLKKKGTQPRRSGALLQEYVLLPFLVIPQKGAPEPCWWFQTLFIFTPNLGEMNPIWLPQIVQMGWFTHQVELFNLKWKLLCLHRSFCNHVLQIFVARGSTAAGECQGTCSWDVLWTCTPGSSNHTYIYLHSVHLYFLIVIVCR